MKRKLTELEWSAVFKARCRSKQGHPNTPGDQLLVERAWHEDPKRYAKEEADVFDATVPFGSSVKARR